MEGTAYEAGEGGSTMISFWWAIVALFVGAIIGMVGMALLVVAARADQEIERFTGGKP
jgi:uncharacterized membrane-anchored protein YhcB (DUF1043 family)